MAPGLVPTVREVGAELRIPPHGVQAQLRVEDAPLQEPLQDPFVGHHLLVGQRADLDRRADEYITNRRIVAVLLIGGTLIGGMIGSISRRRAKARAARERAEGSHGDQGSDRSD